MEMDGMSGHMDHHHGMTMLPPPVPSPSSSTSTSMNMQMQMHHHQMTFFWGEDVEVLFSGFPGDRGFGLYLLSLALVLLAALLVEALSATSRRLLSASSPSYGLLQAVLHAARVGLAYLVMLATMSFNAGVFLAAVAGHALGFLLFSSSASLWARPAADEPAGKP